MKKYDCPKIPKVVMTFVKESYEKFKSSQYNFDQVYPKDLKPEFMEYIGDVCRKINVSPRDKSISIIMTRGSVYKHADCYDKSSVIIPIKFGKQSTFYIGEKSTNLERGKMIRFNDYIEHGLESYQDCHNIFLCVAK